MLDEHEAVTLAVLLEKLAARHPADPLSALAQQQAALLRQRAAGGGEPDLRSAWGSPWSRREVGGDRDDAADRRDRLARERDRRAGERDDLAAQRWYRANAADEAAEAGQQRIKDLLWDAELRDRAAADHAAAGLPAGDRAVWQQWQLDREMTEADRVHGARDRAAIRETLTRSRTGQEAAALERAAEDRDRLASSQDRQSSRADREDAGHDREAARADRDQAVIEGEVEPDRAD